MNESTSFKCKITLYSITLDDKRNDVVIQRLLDKKNLNKAETSNNSLFELDYEQTSSNDKKGFFFKNTIFILIK